MNSRQKTIRQMSTGRGGTGLESRSRRTRCWVLFATLALSCAAGNVHADDADISALERRVAELEALVEELLRERQAPPAMAMNREEMREEVRELAAETTAEQAAVAAEQEAATFPKSSYRFGGYVKADLLYSDYGDGEVAPANIGRDFYIPATIPVGGEGEDAAFDAHAKESRIFFRSDHELASGDNIGTYIELDFLLSPTGDERISNSYTPRMRHAYLTYNNWLFGQTWVTFQNLTAFVDTLDFIGPAESSVFGRQTQIRYTNGPWMVALENPETTVTPFGGGGRIVSDDNAVPDFVLRYNLNRDWGNFTLAGIARQLSYEDDGLGIDDSTFGWGISASGKWMLGRDDIRWMATIGSGLGRYLGLNTANGAVLTSTGELEAIDSAAAYISYRHLWNDQWRSNFTYGVLSIDNDTALTGLGVTESAQSFHINLIYSPQPKIDLGVEFMHADRELESGADGDLDRLQMSAKYSF